MVKRELIDRNNLESTTIVTDDFSGNELLDVVLIEDVKEAPVITEQEIVKPYLEKLKAMISEVNLNKVAKSYEDRFYGFQNEILQMIDNLLSESEVKANENEK